MACEIHLLQLARLSAIVGCRIFPCSSQRRPAASKQTNCQLTQHGSIKWTENNSPFGCRTIRWDASTQFAIAHMVIFVDSFGRRTQALFDGRRSQICAKNSIGVAFDLSPIGYSQHHTRPIHIGRWATQVNQLENERKRVNHRTENKGII